MFKQFVSGVVCLALIQTTLTAGVAGDKAAYRGGTIPLKEGTEAKFSLVGNQFTFQPGNKKNSYTIPYEKIQTVEYGQKAGRRIGAAVALTALVTPLGLFALMSKKRRHMVTLTWVNADGKTDAAVFEFGKDSIRAALNSFEARSGKQIEYESEDAKKNIGK